MMNETYEHDKRELLNMNYQLVTVFTLACFSPYIYFQSPLSERGQLPVPAIQK